jgi:hypothetical protein
MGTRSNTKRRDQRPSGSPRDQLDERLSAIIRRSLERIEDRSRAIVSRHRDEAKRQIVLDRQA